MFWKERYAYLCDRCDHLWDFMNWMDDGPRISCANLDSPIHASEVPSMCPGGVCAVPIDHYTRNRYSSNDSLEGLYAQLSLIMWEYRNVKVTPRRLEELEEDAVRLSDEIVVLESNIRIPEEVVV